MAKLKYVNHLNWLVSGQVRIHCRDQKSRTAVENFAALGGVTPSPYPYHSVFPWIGVDSSMKIEGYTTDKSRSDCYQSLDEFLSTPLPVEQFRGTVFDERNNITYVITPSGITDDATDLAIPLPVAVRIAAMVTACSNDLSD